MVSLPPYPEQAVAAGGFDIGALPLGFMMMDAYPAFVP